LIAGTPALQAHCAPAWHDLSGPEATKPEIWLLEFLLFKCRASQLWHDLSGPEATKPEI